MTSPYQQLGLGEFRVCELLPGERHEALHCYLYVQNIGAVSYDALSYVWGDPKEVSRITCHTLRVTNSDGAGVAAPLPLGVNLLDALKYLRKTDVSVKIWVDAICINQNDIEERNQQVRMMGDIYLWAERVVIRLFTGGWKSEYNLDLGLLKSGIDRWNRPDLLITPHSADTYEGVTPDPNNKNGYKLYNYPENEWVALHALLSHPWFERGWTFQEAVSAKAILLAIGDLSLTWDELINACRSTSRAQPLQAFSEDYVLGGSQLLGERAMNIARIRYHFSSRTRNSKSNESEGLMLDPGTLAISYLLCSRRPSKTQDPRDKLFSLLGIAMTRAEAGWQVDYSASIKDVYINVIAGILTDWTNDNRVLNLCFLSWVQKSNEEHELPSWTPDWTCPLDATPIVNILPQTPTPVQDALGYQVPAPMDMDLLRRGKLSVTSLKLMSIAFQCEVFDSTSTTWDVYDSELCEMLPGLPREYPIYGCSYQVAYLHALYPEGIHPTHQRTSSYWQHSKPFDFVEPPFANDYRNSEQHQKEVERAWYFGENKIQQQHSILCHLYRRLFVSNLSFLGLGPSDSEIGDEVCLLTGSRVPFVIRRLESGEYRVVGECFVFGIMDNEVLDGSSELELEKIILV